MKELLINEIVSSLMLYFKRGKETSIKLAKQYWLKREEDLETETQRAIAMKYDCRHPIT